MHILLLSDTRQIPSYSPIKNVRKYVILDRIIVENWANDYWGFPYPIFRVEYLPVPALTATSDAPEVPRPGRFGRTFYFDIISYFTLKWDKWNCSLPSGVASAFFHRSFSLSHPPIDHYVEIRFNSVWVVNMILVKLKCSLSTHRSLCLFERRYWIWNYLKRRRIYRYLWRHILSILFFIVKEDVLKYLVKIICHYFPCMCKNFNFIFS